MNGEKLRGVNLGGWLVLERWITPSLFEGSVAQDEFSFMQEPDGVEKIKWHRRTFITESDFRWLAHHGVNAVRIPVGYWLFGDEDPFTPTVSYLDWAMEMAEKHGLKVLIDLHGVKGSQNGNDHSGKTGVAAWYRKVSDRRETLELLTRIAKRYKKSPALWGVEVLNEPKLGPRRYSILRQFYKRAYAELATVVRPGTHIVFSDGFMPRLFSGTIRQRWDIIPVIDVHWYQFGRKNLVRYFKRIAKRRREIAALQRKQPVIIGEWSGMLSHQTLAGCAPAERAHLEKRHIEEQLAAYESALGWFYWTYKTEETNSIWNFRTQVENGALAIRS
jgi:glucan 1,3-beta-glucosidase